MKTKYYWNTVGPLAQFYRLVGSRRVEYWSQVDRAWCTSSHRPKHLVKPVYVPLNIKQAYIKAHKVGAVL